jgi:large subunit ribosomal protein L35
MPKHKTKKSLAKRVKLTARGKLMRHIPGSGHLKSRKTAKRIRQFRTERQIPPQFKRAAKRLLGM